MLFFICFSTTLQNVSRVLSSQWIVNVYVYQYLPIERLSMTFIFPANGKKIPLLQSAIWRWNAGMSRFVFVANV